MDFPDDTLLSASLTASAAAVDFGGTNVDVIVYREGAFARRMVPAGPPPSVSLLLSLLAAGGVERLKELQFIAATGGRYRSLPDELEGVPIIKVEELRAIGRGGLAVSGQDEALIVSLGTGTALVGARGRRLQHLGGSGVGGGTLLGLGRLLLGTADALAIDALAAQGDPTQIDLTVGDIVGGPVGMIPAHATAAHFGKASGIIAGTWTGSAEQPGREHVAAGLMNLVGQTTLRLALLAAAANGYETVVLLGHLLDLPSFRQAAGVIGGLFSGRATLPPNPGFAVALGALLEASEEQNGGSAR